jgi:hypothetical protein
MNTFLLTQRLHSEKSLFEVSVNYSSEPLQGWCPLSDSNRPPTDYKSVALPDELKGQSMYLILFHNS